MSDVVDPATQEIIGRVSHAGTAHLDTMLAGAASALSVWQRKTPVERRDILLKTLELLLSRADEIGPMMAREQGRPLGEGKSEVVRAAELIDSATIRKITFTGSNFIGRHLAAIAGQAMKPVTMELGGHGPVIVLDDADPVASARCAAAAKYRNAGQICTSPTRFYVHEAIHERFLDAFVTAANAIKVGSGFEPATQMGPLANARRLNAIESLFDRALRHGARLRAGGHRIGRPAISSSQQYSPTSRRKIRS